MPGVRRIQGGFCPRGLKTTVGSVHARCPFFSLRAEKGAFAFGGFDPFAIDLAIGRRRNRLAIPRWMITIKS
jgi:hypothetical protein